MLGRFLQQDPLGSPGSSQYAYAGSDPCNNSDPTGMKTCYHKVSGTQARQAVDDLNSDGTTATAVGSVAGLLGAGAGAAAGLLCGPGAPACVIGGAVGGAAVGLAPGAALAISGALLSGAGAWLANHENDAWIGYGDTVNGYYLGCGYGDNYSHGPQADVMPSQYWEAYWSVEGGYPNDQ